MITRIGLIWIKFNQKVRNYHRVIEQYPLSLIKSNDYEVSNNARKKYSIKLAKVSIEMWAIFGLLFIELDEACSCLDNDDFRNFDLRNASEVFLRINRKQTKTSIIKIKNMVEFLRHAFCHPEKTSALRVDPYVADTLNMSPEEFDKSYQVTMFNKNHNDPYIKIGGGKIYFNEIDRLIKLLK